MLGDNMNRKGFTLIELLAVVIILLAISVISIASISAVVERNKQRQNDTKMKVIYEHAKLYYDQYKYSGSKFFEFDSLNYVEISLGELDLTDEEMRDADGNYFCGYIKYPKNGKGYEFIQDDTRCGDVVEP